MVLFVKNKIYVYDLQFVNWENSWIKLEPLFNASIKKVKVFKTTDFLIN